MYVLIEIVQSQHGREKAGPLLVWRKKCYITLYNIVYTISSAQSMERFYYVKTKHTLSTRMDCVENITYRK